MDNFVLILAYLAIGLCIRHSSRFSAETPKVLNAVVLYIAFPAVILQKIPQLQVSATLLIPALVPWVLLLLVVAMILLLSRWLQWSTEVKAALLIVLPLGNTSFFGFPMVEAFFGSAGLPYAVIYDQLGSFIALATYATILAAIYGKDGTEVNLKSISLRIITFPPFVALIGALLWRALSQGQPYPDLLAQGIDSLALILVPLIMIAVGFQLNFNLQGERWSPLLSGLGIKLIVMPALAWAGCRLLQLEGLVVQVSIFEAAMPPMMSAGVVAMLAGLAPRLISNLVGFGLLLSFITLPIWYWLLS